MALEFTDKVVLVTGSSSGIGEAAAIEFAKLGACVVITGRNDDRLKLVEEKCKTVSTSCTRKKSVLAIVADVSKDEDLHRLINTVINEFGQLDILVNNAGAVASSLILDSNAVSTFDRIMNTNLRSVFVLTHLALPHLVKTKGNVVIVSSIAGTKPICGSSAYAISKAALDMLTKCLALEVGPHGVRVNCVKPGLIKTQIFNAIGTPQETIDTFFKDQGACFPLGKVGEPEDIANMITFLASSKAINMTGSLVTSDSGSIWAPRPVVYGALNGGSGSR